MHHPRKPRFWHIAQVQFIHLLNVAAAVSLPGDMVFYRNPTAAHIYMYKDIVSVVRY